MYRLTFAGDVHTCITQDLQHLLCSECKQAHSLQQTDSVQAATSTEQAVPTWGPLSQAEAFLSVTDTSVQNCANKVARTNVPTAASIPASMWKKLQLLLNKLRVHEQMQMLQGLSPTERSSNTAHSQSIPAVGGATSTSPCTGQPVL